MADVIVLSSDRGIVDRVWQLRGRTADKMDAEGFGNLSNGYTYTIADMLVTRSGGRVTKREAEEELRDIYEVVAPFNRAVFDEAWELVERVNGGK